MNEVSVSVKNYFQADVLVVGGGSAGCVAAISSAKSGAKTLLIEKNGMLGGTATVAGVNFPGLFFAWGKQIIAGPCWDIIKDVIGLGGAVMPKISEAPEKHWHEQILVNRFVYAYLLDQHCRKAGVDIIFHTMICDVFETESGVRAVTACKEGAAVIDAKVLIDATADANIAAMMGYKTVQSRPLQPATLINDISGYELEKLDKNEIIRKTAAAIQAGQLPKEFGELSVLGFLKERRITFHAECGEAATSVGKSGVEVSARDKLFRIFSFMKTIKGLENLQVTFVAEECGIRETNRIVGEYCITESDYLSGVVFEDAICYAFYPVDLHVVEGIQKVYHQKGRVPTVPYRAIIPKSATKILVPGRSLSSDTRANSGLRVQAACMARGQAAGCAAAIAAAENVPVLEVDYKRLCQSLEKIGAIVPKQL